MCTDSKFALSARRAAWAQPPFEPPFMREMPTKTPGEQPVAAPGQFRIATLEGGYCQQAAFNRRDFYKISLVLAGCSRLVHEGREVLLTQPALVFTSPANAYCWEHTGGEPAGYFCLFDYQFLQAPWPGGHQPAHCPFRAGTSPVQFPTEEQLGYLTQLFARMRQEAEAAYVHQRALLRSQVEVLFHEAAKMQLASSPAPPPPTAAHRITQAFLHLLDAQFPVGLPQPPLRYKKAGDYASHLAVHVNHLNAAVQEVTGKPTTRHITERLLAEATALLLHTDWSVADIAYCLGFSYVTYFDNFFKKQTGTTPLACRKAA